MKNTKSAVMLILFSKLGFKLVYGGFSNITLQLSRLEKNMYQKYVDNGRKFTRMNEVTIHE
jgi:hypothetical protein